MVKLYQLCGTQVLKTRSGQGERTPNKQTLPLPMEVSSKISHSYDFWEKLYRQMCESENSWICGLDKDF